MYDLYICIRLTCLLQKIQIVQSNKDLLPCLKTCQQCTLAVNLYDVTGVPSSFRASKQHVTKAAHSLRRTLELTQEVVVFQMTRKRALSLPFMAGRSVKLGLALIQCRTFVSSIVKYKLFQSVYMSVQQKDGKEAYEKAPSSLCYQRKLQECARWTRKDPGIHRSLQT